MPSAGRGKDVADAAFVEALEHAGEPLKTTEIAQRVGLKRRGTLNRLKAHDAIDGKQGVWWLTQWLPGTNAATGTHTVESDTSPDFKTEIEPDADEADSIEAAIADLDYRGNAEQVEQRQAAVRACYDLLRKQGSATKPDFIAEVFGEHPAGYGSPEAWWNEIGNSALKQLADEVSAIESPSRGQSKWRLHR